MKIYIFICCLGLLIFGSGCNSDSTTLVFTLPNGFSGLALIAEDKTEGLDLQKNGSEYFVEVPLSGKLTIKSLKPLTDWHKTTAHYKDGTSLPVEAVSEDNKIGLFTLPYVEGKGVFYFVGSRAEFKSVSSMSDFEKLPLATKIIMR